jgi:hypothetical protein
MAIVFEQIVTFSAANPATSGSFTPVVPGSNLACFVQDGISGTTPVFTGTGTWSNVGSSISLPGVNNSLGTNLSSTAGAQTVTVTALGGAFRCILAEYAGAASIGSYSSVQTINPGVGAGAILGTSIVVPIGSTLIAYVVDETTGTAISNTSGTSRSASSIGGQTYNFVDYAGAGSAIQPAFTCTTGNTDTFNISQWILTPGGGGNTATIAWVS